METGCVPLRYVISSRRIMYLHHILNRDDNELISRIFKAQQKAPTKGDFIELVMEDLKMIDESEETVKNSSKAKLKSIVKTKVNEVALESLKEKLRKHTKVKDIEYTKLKVQEYMKDPEMTNKMVETMFALRSSMVKEVKQNFVSSGVRTQCPLNCRDTSQDTQRHLVECPVLRTGLTVAEDKVLEVTKYDDIFGEMQDQKRAVYILTRLLEIRESFLEDLPVGAITGPSLHCTYVASGNK